MSDLEFHSNIDEVTDPSLIPEETDSYKPLPNETFIKKIYNMVNRANLQVESQRFKTNRKKTQVFGTFKLNDSDGQFSTQVAMINSYDKSRSAALAIGANVGACSNLSFSSYKAFRMHKGKNFWRDINEIMHEASKRLTDGKKSIQSRYNTLEKVELSGNDQDWVLGHFLRSGVLGVNQVSHLKKTLTGEIDYVFGTDNWFHLNMHVTESLKKSHPYNLVDDHMKAEGRLVKMCQGKLKTQKSRLDQQGTSGTRREIDEMIEGLTSPLDNEDIFLN